MSGKFQNRNGNANGYFLVPQGVVQILPAIFGFIFVFYWIYVLWVFFYPWAGKPIITLEQIGESLLFVVAQVVAGAAGAIGGLVARFLKGM